MKEGLRGPKERCRPRGRQETFYWCIRKDGLTRSPQKRLPGQLAAETCLEIKACDCVPSISPLAPRPLACFGPLRTELGAPHGSRAWLLGPYEFRKPFSTWRLPSTVPTADSQWRFGEVAAGSPRWLLRFICMTDKSGPDSCVV